MSTPTFATYIVESSSNGIFIRGVVHWLGSFLNAATKPEKRVIAFDLECEEYRKIPLPDHQKNNINDYARLNAWGESICLFIKDHRDWLSHIFVMKEYGVTDSWYDNKLLLQQKGLHYLVLYDTKSSKTAKVNSGEDLEKVFNAPRKGFRRRPEGGAAGEEAPARRLARLERAAGDEIGEEEPLELERRRG
ncbi:hypothetical protein Scep_010393 [Stephania cephalantha]|uniref:Uncharacterized protein n=1 Tax=Stephania cephalantha TaxID=152367 RepID=A0AAP0JV13_9MAGN